MSKRPAEIDVHVGKRIRRRRKLLGWSLKRLGEAVGCDGRVVQFWEVSRCRIPVSQLFKVSVALNVPMNYFFSGLEGAVHQKSFGDEFDDV
jgi:transcriptional regulator with XRE-family HTH domain